MAGVPSQIRSLYGLVLKLLLLALVVNHLVFSATMGSLFSSDKGKGSSNGSKGGNGKAASASNKNTNPQSQVTSKDRAILDLKNAKDRLKKFKKKVVTRVFSFVCIGFDNNFPTTTPIAGS